MSTEEDRWVAFLSNILTSIGEVLNECDDKILSRTRALERVGNLVAYASDVLEAGIPRLDEE